MMDAKKRSQKEKAFVILCFLLSILLLLQNDLHLSRHVTLIEKTVLDLQHSPPHLPQPRDAPRRRRIKFIPYPHKSIASGTSAACHWETIDQHNNTQRITKLTGNTKLDYTQQSALSQGICTSPSLEEQYHIFSSAEAIDCLSSSSSTIVLTGDSYMKQMYNGLADILLSKHVSGDEEIVHSNQRNRILQMAETLLVNRRQRIGNSSFPLVIFGCQPELCYGKANILNTCSECIQTTSAQYNHQVLWVLGIGIHSISRHYQCNKTNYERAIHSTMDEITTLLNRQRQQSRNVIWVSSPGFHINPKYPTQHTRMEEFYQQLVPVMATSRIPFLDVFQATDSCVWKNCSEDGSHRSRFVNRWKAQSLLNMLCEV